MLSLRRPSRAVIDSWLQRQKQLTLNYPEVGGTRDQPPTHGYNIDRYTVQLGKGQATYARAVAALRGKRMWDFGWIEICWPTTPLDVGAILATLTRQAGIWFLNACRVVYVLDEAGPHRRFGFAYGTLQGHIERGEERFTVEWRAADDTVWYEILAFSRPAHWLMTIGYPYMRRVQRRFGADSLSAFARAVAMGPEDAR